MLNSSRFALGLLLPLTLAACSTPSTPGTPVAFYGDGLDHSWTATAQEGQQLLSALTSPLKTQGVDLGVTLALTASNGWGPIEVNTSNGETAAGDGKTLTMKGKTYATGLGVHGDSEIHIQATGLVTPACTRFKADIGIDDEVGANGKYSSVVFQVYADGKQVYDSGLVTGSTPTRHVDIPVGNKSDLRFVVTHGPDLNYYDHADWAGATLACPTPITSSPVVSWGANDYGEGTVPADLGSVTAIAAAEYHSLALKQDGTVAAWGDDTFGETSVPSGLTGVTAIAIGENYGLALKQDGTVVSWGLNNVPAGLTGIKAIAGGFAHSLALKQDGTVVGWGNNQFGQTDIPADLKNVQAVAAGLGHSLALKSDGTIVAWGRNDFGQINVPFGLNGVKAIAAGAYFNLALKTDGTVVAWGDNQGGQTTVPVGLKNVQAISAGAQHSLALLQDGTVIAWGNNANGQTNVPTGLTGVKAIAAGAFYNLALR